MQSRPKRKAQVYVSDHDSNESLTRLAEIIKLAELGEVSFGISKLGELGEVSFGMFGSYVKNKKAQVYFSDHDFVMKVLLDFKV